MQEQGEGLGAGVELVPQAKGGPFLITLFWNPIETVVRI